MILHNFRSTVHFFPWTELASKPHPTYPFSRPAAILALDGEEFSSSNLRWPGAAIGILLYSQLFSFI